MKTITLHIVEMAPGKTHDEEVECSDPSSRMLVFLALDKWLLSHHPKTVIRVSARVHGGETISIEKE
jgi:hypothetical protein